MRSKTLLTALAALLALTVCDTGAQERVVKSQDPSVKRIIPGGVDGQHSYYKVRCFDDVYASLVVEHAEGVVCAVPYRAARRCDKKWTLRDAAERACKASKRG